MARCSLLIVCLLVISLQFCASETQAGKYRDDLFRISTSDEYESLNDLEDGTIFQTDDKQCSSNSDCMYGGNCSSNGVCTCPKGTNGTLCENVIQCMKHPEMCGNGTDVECVFDVKVEYAHCKCTDKKKFYNDFAERCQEPCRYQVKKEIIEKDCGLYGRCTNSFCWCIQGVSGDFCGKIDQCEKVDCGDDPLTTCILDINGAYCKCNKTYQVFDKKEKVCKGEPCRKNTDCMNGGECTDDGTCSCPSGTDGPLCQDVLGCIENPNMCGNGTDVQCVFDTFDKKASCRCDDSKKHFNKLIGKCAEPCEKFIKHEIVREDCGEYGRCLNSFCWCVKGVSGDRCETIDQCASGEVDCSNDPVATCSLGVDGAYCKCNKTYQMFDKKEKLCRGEPCKNDTDCFYEGNCTEDGSCICRKGVGGPLCQQVLECEKNPDMCGSGTDVKCVFDVKRKKAVCQCDNDDEMGFDVIEKKCKKFCDTDEDCGMYGRCDKKYFCRCLEGVSGDNCEIIEKCKKMDCGPRINCTLGSDMEAHCKCPDPHMGFDYEAKTCKACDCGGNFKGCEFVDGKEKCECSLNYYLKDNKCEACNCGDLSKGCELRDGKKECFCPLNYTTIEDTCQKCKCGIASYHCKMEDGKMKCICYDPYKQRKDKCEFCDCGVHGGECSFDESGEKQCLCKTGFKMAKDTGLCTEMCNATKTCQNRGVCEEGLCKCDEDYTGALCETPKWCVNSRCGNGRDEVECVWSKVKKEGRCECKKPNHLYLEDLRQCTECDCGPNGRCILTERGEKVCICREGYADYLLKCKRCDCGPSSTNCTFQMLGKKLCQCRENYKQKNIQYRWSDEDYSQCYPCNCGKHGTCRYAGEDKVCDCEDNYKVFNGACKECNCGPYGFCSFDSSGNKVCTCDFGYADFEGRCAKCDCEPPSMRGIGSVCLFEESKKVCHCPVGYENPKNDFCEDINECLNSTACAANAECINLPGSYRCECKKGFKVPNPTLDPKKFGCEDINECIGNPCTGSNTVCINTPGGYDCKCKNGHYPTSAVSGPYYNPKYATCNKEETQWRGASIALGVILSIGIIGLGGYIIYQRKRNWR